MKNRMRLLAALLGLIPFCSSDAALLEVSGAVGWSCDTGSGGFEPGCAPRTESGQVWFRYDTGTAAITSFEMTVAQSGRPDLTFDLDGAGTITTHSSPDGDLQLYLHVPTLEAILGSGQFNLMAHAGGFSPNLTTLPGVPFWQRAAAFIGSGYGVSETDWGYSFAATEVAPPQARGFALVAPSQSVPEPATAVLVLVALVGLGLTRSRT